MAGERCRICERLNGATQYYQRDREDRCEGKWVATPFFVLTHMILRLSGGYTYALRLGRDGKAKQHQANEFQGPHSTLQTRFALRQIMAARVLHSSERSQRFCLRNPEETQSLRRRSVQFFKRRWNCCRFTRSDRERPLSGLETGLLKFNRMIPHRKMQGRRCIAYVLAINADLSSVRIGF
jgi:hypothetical protein